MSLLQEELQVDRNARPDLTTEDAWLAFIRFGRRRFDTPGTPDADGLLFQYGTCSFDGPATFTLDLTRQFEVNDSDGDHDHPPLMDRHVERGPASRSGETRPIRARWN